MAGYRDRASYISKDPEKRLRGLANILKPRGKARLKKTKEFIPPWSSGNVKKYRENIIEFVENNIILTETGKLVKLEGWQKKLFYKPIFMSDPHVEQALVTIPKKNSKSWMMMTALLWAWSTSGKRDQDAEYFVCSNDLYQSQSIIMKKAVAAITRNPYLFAMAEISSTEIRNKFSGAVIIPVARDFRGSAGLSPKWVCYDEMSLMDLDEQEKLVEELQISPIYEGRSLIMVASTMGYKSEGMFWDMFQEGKKNQPGSPEYDPTFYSLIIQNENPASFVADTYLARQKKRLKPNQFARMHLNLPVEGEGSLISAEVYDKNVNPVLVRRPSREAIVFVGIDASIRHDSCCLCAIERGEDGRFTLIDHSIVTPHEETLDLEAVIERWVLELQQTYVIEACGYDPWEMSVISKHLTDEGIEMIEVRQNARVMGQAVASLFSCLRQGYVQMYPDPVIRQHLLNCSVEERKDGSYKLVKSSQRKHIDFVVSLACAIYASMQEGEGQGGEPVISLGSWGAHGSGRTRSAY